MTTAARAGVGESDTPLEGGAHRRVTHEGATMLAEHRLDDTDLRNPDDTRVIATPPGGPVFGGSRPTRTLSPTTLVPALSRPTRIAVALCTVGWIVCLVSFWAWWLSPVHRVHWFGFFLNSALLFYLTYLPGYFLVTANRMTTVNPLLPVPQLRTAFVVTRAPSEPWEVARRTLGAMLDQVYPHPYDVWLCDEDPSPEIAAWCELHDVRLSTRRGIPEYHRSEWPRRTKCKEGNLAYFYDSCGYEDYDVVSQLDCDHVPSPTYLAEMVRPFSDPAIGYVAAPSVCDSNAAVSWAARGRLHREGPFHGPFQLGHHKGLAPVCIGSHYAVRTSALRQIGGVGPELAEDFSTTFLLSSAGWQGAFAHDAEAHGEGPLTTGAMLTQEFQWSRSLVTVLFDTVPRHLGRFPWRLRARFLFALIHYPLLAITVTAGLAIPVYVSISGNPWANINYFEFLLRWVTIPFWLLVITVILRRRKLLRPAYAPIFSWENWLYTLVRWPFIAWGVIAATRQKIRPTVVGFKVTPKEPAGLEPLPSRLVLPSVVFSLILGTSSLIGESLGHRSGYIVLGIVAAAVYLTVSLAVCSLHAVETARASGSRLLTAVRRTIALPLLFALLPAVPLFSAVAFAGPALDNLVHPPPGSGIQLHLPAWLDGRSDPPAAPGSAPARASTPAQP